MTAHTVACRLPTSHRAGFSLVELSIVLVILGLLVGGILAGQSLIKASELRAVSTDLQRYKTASSAFRDKYFGVPGDFKDARNFWPTQCVDSGTDLCNGNGDGRIAFSGTHGDESLRTWQHLALAGLIEGSYTGIAPVAVSTSIPASRIANGGYYPSHQVLPDRQGNLIELSGGGAGVGVLKAEEAWNLDSKMDDGMPYNGPVQGNDGTGGPGCVVTVSSVTRYDLVQTSPACTLWFFIDSN